MKTQSILKTVLLAAGFSAFAFIGSAQAAPTVNVQYDAGGGNYVGTGAGPGSGTYWTDVNVNDGNAAFPYTATNLKASDGTTVTGISAVLNDAMNAGGARNGGATTPANKLLQGGYLDNYSTNNSGLGPFTLTLSGVSASDSYNLYLYGAYGAANAADTTFTIGATTQGVLNSANATPGNFVLGDNYVEFTGLTGSTTITTNITANYADGAFPIISGFQLVDTTVPVEAPEPSTYALLGLGALALLVISRRRTA